MTDSAETTPPQDSDEQRNRSLMISVDTNSIWKVVAIILTVLALLWMMGQAQHLIGLIVFSFFLSLALQPLVLRLVDRFGWRRGAAVGVIYLAGIAGVFVFTLILIPSIVTLADSISENGEEWLASGAEWIENTFGIDIREGFDNDITTDLGDEIQEWAMGAAGNIVGIAGSGLGLAFDLATVAMFTFYFTADAPRFQRTVLRLLPAEQQQRIGWTWDQAIVQTGGYFYSRVILMLINAIGFFFTMLIVGVPVALALALGIFGGFVAAFIPAIGTYLGSAVPILVTLAVSGVVGALVVLGYALVYQQIENYFLSPKISSNTMALNGAVAFGAALAGGAIFGPLGAFVALPVAALITVFISNFATHNEVVYEFEYDKHLEASREAAKEQAADKG